MQSLGPVAFWLVPGATFAIIAAYARYGMTKCSMAPVEETESYFGALSTDSPVAVEADGTD